jgi:hypothetical protein
LKKRFSPSRQAAKKTFRQKSSRQAAKPPRKTFAPKKFSPSRKDTKKIFATLPENHLCVLASLREKPFAREPPLRLSGFARKTVCERTTFAS